MCDTIEDIVELFHKNLDVNNQHILYYDDKNSDNLDFHGLCVDCLSIDIPVGTKGVYYSLVDSKNNMCVVFIKSTYIRGDGRICCDVGVCSFKEVMNSTNTWSELQAKLLLYGVFYHDMWFKFSKNVIARTKIKQFLDKKK